MVHKFLRRLLESLNSLSQGCWQSCRSIDLAPTPVQTSAPIDALEKMGIAYSLSPRDVRARLRGTLDHAYAKSESETRVYIDMVKQPLRKWSKELLP